MVVLVALAAGGSAYALVSRPGGRPAARPGGHPVVTAPPETAAAAAPVGSATSAAPVGSVGPAAPVGSVAPIGSVAPAGPVGSVAPIGSVAPAGPVGSVAPIGSAPATSTAAALASSPARAGAPSGASPSASAPASSDQTGTVQLAAGVIGNPATPGIEAYLNRYFYSINTRNYAEYISLLDARRQQGEPRSSFDSGYATTRDSRETLTGVQGTDNGGGTLVAIVSFTSQQSPADSTDGSACNNWRLTMDLAPQGSSYVLTGVQSAHTDC